ncbi:MAG: imidazole glycerol phosphate synthase subunit HisH [Planctomycetia bacterium]|nr:imidazole glycerol phosphate synthase subunit HisH [Planctomycetia bacterium]
MIAILDYGMGNLGSVRKALERVSEGTTEIVVTSDPTVVRRADKLLLPGVGAFRDAMEELRTHRLVEPVREAVSDGRPFLGICLGLQMLFRHSYEGVDGTESPLEGLGIIPGEVVRFQRSGEFPVPHIGWNQVQKVAPNPLLEGIPDQTFFYFVHSFYVVPEDLSVVAAETDYGGRFCSMIRRGNLFACQFHPEKSQNAGLSLLRNFVQM